MRSIQVRLSVGLFVSLVIVFALLWWLSGATLRNLAEDYLSEHLQHDGESILNALEIRSDGSIGLDRSKIEPAFERPDSGQYYRIVSAHADLHSGSLGDRLLEVSVSGEQELVTRYQVGSAGEPLLVRAQNFRIDGVSFTILTAEDLTPTLRKIDLLRRRSSIIAFGLLIVLVGIQLVILRSGFQPLQRIRDQLHELEQGRRRSLDADVPSEVAELVGEVNRLLQDLQRRLEQSRNTLSDLAHAIKTPLTVIQRLSQEDPGRSSAEIGSAIHEQINNLHRLMERVLKRGRLAGHTPGRENLDASKELRDLLDALQLMYREKNLRIDLNTVSGGNLPIDREDLLELAGNLVDNACKWARKRVAVRLLCGDPETRLIVEDDGPGVSDAQLLSLSRRGLRLDERVTGHGLGLSIARLITEQYHGSLVFDRSGEIGGLRATAVLQLNTNA